MKLVRFGLRGHEKPGLVDSSGALRDVSAQVGDWRGSELSPERLRAIAALDPAGFPKVPESPRIGPCVAGVGKIVCIGKNYAAHARETGSGVPEEPVVFLKPSTAIIGPNDDVMLPRGSEKADWEIELGLVIGTHASYVEEADALEHVAGFCIANDVSERSFQLERGGGQWTKGKSCDTFAPIGPWLVTLDELADKPALGLSLSVNSKCYQNSDTGHMIFGPAALVSYVSQFMTLEPGDVIMTGTPEGIGSRQNPPVFLKPGDVMELTIEGLGAQRQRVVTFSR